MARGDYEGVSSGNADAQTIVVPVFLGFIFGFFYSKAGTYLPTAQFAQWALKCNLFIKFILAAVIVSLLCGSLMSVAGDSSKRRFEYSRNIGTNGALAVTVGAIVAGVGMTTAGSTAASAFVQAGGGVWSGFYVILGGLMAVVLYGYLYESLFSKFVESGRGSVTSLDEALKTQYAVVAIPLAAALSIFCYFLETKMGQNWTAELPSGVSADNKTLVPRFGAAVWNPYLCGALVGLLQLPLRFSIGASLSSTFAYVSPIAVTLRVLYDALDLSMPRWFKHRSGTAGLWALVFFVSAAFGSLLAAQLGGTFRSQQGFGVQWCLLAGFLLVLGNLIMGVCPLGLAISGCSDLNLMSILAALVLLGTTVGTAQLFQHENIHPESSTYQSVNW